MGKVTTEDVVARYRRSKERKAPWDRMYEKALDFASPMRQAYKDSPDKNKNNADIVFDSTAEDALDGFVANLQSALFPPGKKWIQLRCGHAIQEENREELNKQLEAITDVVFEALRVSNFDTEMSSSLYDLAFGMGALLVEKGDSSAPLRFTSVHIANIVIEEGPHGRVDAAHRESALTLENIERTWPDASIPDEMRESAKETPDKKFSLIESVIPDYVMILDKEAGTMAEVQGYCYKVIALEGEHLLLEDDRSGSPWVIFRWPVLSGELYSRGPMLKAMPDVKTLNKVKELLLKRGSRDVYGLYTYLDDGVINIENIKFGYNAFIPVESNGGARGPSILPLPPTGSLDLSQFLFNDLKQSVNKMLFAEPLGPIDLPVKSATEVAIRQQNLARKSGPSYGRMLYECVIPLLSRILYVLEEMGRIELPDEFKSVDGRVIGVDYLSPIAQAQDVDDLMAIRQYQEAMVGFFGPQLGLAMSDPQRVAEYVAEKLHVPKRLLPTQEEFAQMRQALVQMVAQQTAGAQTPPVEDAV